MRPLFSFFAKSLFKKDYTLLSLKLKDLYDPIEFTRERKEIQVLERMLIIAEDHRFKYHIGFDPIAIIRAIRNRIFFKKIEGASTIEQQLVRIVTKQYQRTISRKIKEILLATTIRDIIPQQDIPLMYLKNAYYGVDGFGYQQTLSKIKYHINSEEENAAEIISRIKYPESSNNLVRTEQIKRRKVYLMKRSQKLSKIKT